MGWLMFIFIVPAGLGIWMVLYGLELTLDVNWYFGGVLKEQGLDIENYTVPPTLFIVVGFFLFLLAGLLLLAMAAEKRVFFASYLLLMGCTMVIQILALTLLIKGDGSQMPQNIMISSIDEYYNDSSPAQNVYVQFWNYLQKNRECCGINSYADWATASQAPQVGFIPESCCTGDNRFVVNCTGAITKGIMNNVAFVESLIFMKGCLTKNNESFQILLMEVFSGFTMLFQVFGMVIAYLGCASVIKNPAGYESV